MLSDTNMFYVLEILDQGYINKLSEKYLRIIVRDERFSNLSSTVINQIAGRFSCFEEGGFDMLATDI